VKTGSLSLSTIVSRYVAVKYCQLATNQARQMFFDETRRLSTNPALLGWITELEIVSALEHVEISSDNLYQVQFIETLDKNYKRHYLYSNIIKYLPETNLNDVLPNTLLMPLDWRNPTFDFAILGPSGKLVLFQVTDAKHHDYSVEVMAQFANRFNRIKSIEYVILCRDAKLFTVTAPPLENLQNEWKSKATPSSIPVNKLSVQKLHFNMANCVQRVN
jgi:hypothetical protein